MDIGLFNETLKKNTQVPVPDYNYCVTAREYLTPEEYEKFMELCIAVSRRWWEKQKKNDGESYSG